MRKVFWCCTAFGVLAAGVIGLAAHSVWHPETLIYQSAAASAAALVDPMAGLGTVAARYLHGPAAAETLTQAAPEEECEPDEPRPVPACDLPHPAVVRGPAPIVIREEEPAKVEADAEASEPSGHPCHGAGPCVTGTLCPPATLEFGGPAPAQAPDCPLVMPYCVDEEAPVPPMPSMPRADEEGVGAAAKTLFQFWTGFFGATKEAEGGVETAEPARADGAPDCQEDAHYDEHYSGCPYTGYHLPSQRCPVTPTEAEPAKRPGQEECSEEPAPKKHKVHYPKCGRGQECPKHPDVDTMEYRKSDGGLNEYGPGPF